MFGIVGGDSGHWRLAALDLPDEARRQHRVRAAGAIPSERSMSQQSQHTFTRRGSWFVMQAEICFEIRPTLFANPVEELRERINLIVVPQMVQPKGFTPIRVNSQCKSTLTP